MTKFSINKINFILNHQQSDGRNFSRECSIKKGHNKLHFSDRFK